MKHTKKLPLALRLERKHCDELHELGRERGLSAGQFVRQITLDYLRFGGAPGGGFAAEDVDARITDVLLEVNSLRAEMRQTRDAIACALEAVVLNTTGAEPAEVRSWIRTKFKNGGVRRGRDGFESAGDAGHPTMADTESPHESAAT